MPPLSHPTPLSHPDPVAATADVGPSGWRRWLEPVVGAAGVVTALMLTVGTWGAGLGRSLATVPQEHDMVVNTYLVAEISRSGQASPWAAFAQDPLTGGPGSFYPAGFHTLAALVADLGADPVTALNATTLAVLALALPLGLVALATQVARGFWPLAVGGVAAVVASAAYRPTYAFLHDGGILGNLMGIMLSVGAAAGVLAMSRSAAVAGRGVGGRAVAVVLTAALVLAVFTVHPTSVAVVGLTVLPWLLADLVHRDARRIALRRIAVLAGAGVLFAVAAAPLVSIGGGAAGTVGEWPRDLPSTSFTEAAKLTFGLPYFGFLDLQWLHNQTLLAVLVLTGAAVLLLTRRGTGLLAAWLVWSGVLLAYLVGVDLPVLRTVTGLFYNSYARISGVLGPLQWLLAGVAVTAGAVVLGRAGEVVAAVARRRPAPRVGRAWVAGAALLLGAVLVVLTSGYRTTDAVSLAQRYGDPQFQRVDDDDLAAFAFLRRVVEPGERVMNNANDGSTYAYVLDGVPVVNVNTLGSGTLPYTQTLLADFDRIDTDPQVRELVRELDIHWVYVDSEAPPIGVVRAFYPWYRGPAPYTLAPGLADLDRADSLVRRFSSGTVTVYEVRDSVFAGGSAG